LACRGGDALGVRVVVGRQAGPVRAAGRVRCSEQLGGPVRLAAEYLCPGKAGKSLSYSLRVTEFRRGGEGLQVA
jgi:hypothetical protein